MITQRETTETSTTIRVGEPLMTLINVFTVEPARQQELVDLLIDATENRMRDLPGFISANIHLSADGKQVVNYAQWSSRDAFEVISKDPEAAIHMKKAAEIATFNPIVCEVVHVDHV